MKKKTLHIIFLSLGLLMVAGYLVFAFHFFKINEEEIKCTDLIININGSVDLVSEDEVHQMLNDQLIHPIGLSINQLPINQIEDFLLENPFITKASCHFTPQGLVFLKIDLREPKFIVASGENYYVDRERVIIPIPLQSNAYLPIVTGRVTKTMATEELFDFVDVIEKDEFWNAQIAQIHVRSDLQIELSPRVGNTKLLLDKLNDAEEKLQQVYHFYQEGMNKLGWNRYEYLDLRFNNQIIGIKH